MKKLHLEDVRVESFVLGAKQNNTRGTVMGNARTDYCTADCGDTSTQTCGASCNVTACHNDCMSAVYIMGHCTMP
jgi:hypothetical protein